MARSTAQNYDEKREAITSEAAILFAQKGFGGASISDISNACNVSKSLIYHYYRAKEDILFDVMSTHINDLIDVTFNSSHDHIDPKTEFHNLTKALLACYAGAENAQKVLLYELNNLLPQQRKDIVAKQRLIVSRFESVYLKIFPELKNETGLSRSKIMLFFGMVNWIHTWFNPEGDITRDELAAMATDTILG